MTTDTIVGVAMIVVATPIILTLLLGPLFLRRQEQRMAAEARAHAERLARETMANAPDARITVNRFRQINSGPHQGETWIWGKPTEETLRERGYLDYETNYQSPTYPY